MICLGIEGTAHSYGVGIITNEKKHCNVLANIIHTYQPPQGGIHPREAANHHVTYADQIIKEALTHAHLTLPDIDLISFSQGPGLGPCLRTAATAARALALTLNKPLIGVNHCVAHLEIGRGTIPACTNPILLYVSGANTQIIGFAEGKYRVFGETLDIGIGNCLDKFGRYVNLAFPAGPKIETLAQQGTTYYPLPYTIKGMDVAFSGLLTGAQQYISRHKPLKDICYSIQETTFAALTEVTERAMAHTEKKQVLLGGGVASNTRLRDMVKTMADERHAQFFVPRKDLCIDNGAMIAWLGYVMHIHGHTMTIKQSKINQRYRTDMVEVTWYA
ncbi:MAG: bifunctional N(6)-L-threonylcarbamoyladenine synthase/serine/threonine protein kinase [Candidatus Thermoplasmatota archaeon]|nr:bifunctional N(6)-L-threonylcarbamoyladenine synthase/serine/threonine protein kinase [Candidatus Thermoplasmatota archaeon]MBU1940280.1 bifunctional N(6)-L-threonylcarbamoyladenine synthase/serine/threonine protein kinase [Candidatus Thermoplasmatota archaeon]